MKSLKPSVEMSQSVLKAMSGFKPIFGSSEDRNIITRYSKIVDMLNSIDSVAFRALVKNKKFGQLTAKMKEIRELEIGLIKMVNERNTL